MTNDYLNALEQLNKEKQELLQRREYRIGEVICRFGYNIVHLRMGVVLKDIKDKMASMVIKKRLMQKPPTKYMQHINVEYTKGKIAVYTCITGGYDDLSIPLVKLPGVDYFLLTDNSSKYEGFRDVFNIIQIPEEVMRLGKVFANRYVKFHPFEFFNEYDYSIYMDGNIRVVADIRKFVTESRVNTGISMHRHRERNCIYQEGEACILLGRGDKKKIKSQIERYKKEGFPENFGMNEATVIVADLKNYKSKDLLDIWWNEFIESGSMRDQLAWPYILWKNGYTINDVGNLGDDIYKNYKIEIVRHALWRMRRV